MSGLEVVGCIMVFSLVGWIPIYFFFNGMTDVILAIKIYHQENDEENVNDNKENIDNGCNDVQ